MQNYEDPETASVMWWENIGTGNVLMFALFVGGSTNMQYQKYHVFSGGVVYYMFGFPTIHCGLQLVLVLKHKRNMSAKPSL